MNKERAVITHVQHWSLHDGPGLRTTVYFKGCFLECRWCHNPETISRETQTLHYKHSNRTETVGRTIGLDELLSEIISDKLFYDDSNGGVTFSGGEPLQQADFVRSLAKACKDNSVHTALDTTLFTKNEIVHSMLDVIDLFLIDVKIINSEKHKKFTGAHNDLILKNIRDIVGQLKVPAVLRTPLVKGVNDFDEDLIDFKNFYLSIDPYEQLSVELLPYHKFGEGKYEALSRPYLIKDGEMDKERIDLFLKTLQQTGHQVSINTF